MTFELLRGVECRNVQFTVPILPLATLHAGRVR